MKILPLGKNGRVGRSLQYALDPLDQAIALGGTGADGVAGDLIDLPFMEYYMTAAKRPLNAIPDGGRLRYVFDIQLPEWESGVSRNGRSTESV